MKTLNQNSSRFTNEQLLQEKIESVDIYKCMTCGSSFDIRNR
ncbi:MAG: hypothetical protein PHH61_04135 [Candidatus Nanoarchaeia archaeon]|nr:hypothetical protein [Candidatus Nanoarchaeia archaeon]